MSVRAMSPWSDSNEFLVVFDSVYQNKDPLDLNYELLVFARNKLTIWLARSQHNLDISVTVLATKEIVNAMIEDHKNCENDDPIGDESAVYSLYALSVIRFCNAISQYSHEDNMKSVKRLAHRYSCPQWIIDCRHNLCHSSTNQPTLEELRTASMIGLNWLKQYFWLRIIDNYKNRSNSNRNYFNLIDKYLNKENTNNSNNKSKNKMKNDIINSLKQFPNDFLSVLIQHLINPINSEANPEKTVNFESLKIPKFYLRRYSKILSIVIENNLLSIVLNLLVRHFDSEDQRISHLAISWFATLVNAIEADNRISKFKRIFRGLTSAKVMPKIEWIRLLYSLTKRPNDNTRVLIQLIAPIVSDVIPESKIEMLANLAEVFSRKSLTDETDSNLDTEFRPKTIEDLVSATDHINGSPNETNDTTDWSEINFGASVTSALVTDTELMSPPLV